MHSELIAEHGGERGLREVSLLESALARPRSAWGYGEHRLQVLAAKYGHGLARNHPFVDGNKRVALAAIDVFLQLNGKMLSASEEETAIIILDLAAGKLDESSLASWIEENAARS
jgi:death-on-curing protein